MQKLEVKNEKCFEKNLGLGKRKRGVLKTALYNHVEKLTGAIRKRRIAFYGTHRTRFTNKILAYFIEKQIEGVWYVELERQEGITSVNIRESRSCELHWAC